MSKKQGFNTRLLHAGIKPDPSTGAILPPIFQTSTYVLEEVGKLKGFDYTRSSNPTRQTLEENLAGIEGAKYAVCFASGMSAVDAIFRGLSSGDHIVCSDDVYGGVIRLLNTVLNKFGIEVTYVNSSEAKLVEEAIKPNTKLIWIETPTNPLMKVSDLEAISKIAKAHKIPLGVDSTFATPALLRPLEWGADIVMHSTTKYISGHNQIIGGAVLTNNEEIFQSLKYMQKSIGAVPSPFDCWLTILGVRTLGLRMEKHSSNAIEVAKYLSTHPKIARVAYPGLESDPGYSIAKKQMSNFGGMMSFELKGGIEAGRTLMNSVKLLALAESLGAVESMVTHPATMTHASVPKEARMARGLTDGLVRLSVGIEDLADIIDDLEQALSKA